MSRRDDWDANIETARESGYSDLSEPGADGNREYPNGTYGQSDYTVRERSDGTFDLYTKNGEKHGHDRLDAEGNLIESYHDYLIEKLFMLNKEQLRYILSKTNSECIAEITEMLKQPESKKLVLKNK